MEAKADINQADKTGYAALSIAVLFRYDDLVVVGGQGGITPS